jgi:cytochrome c oxidase cbb3-type subunit I
MTASPPERAIAYAAWHSLFWLVFANAVGVLIAALLIVPAIGKALGDWTYGRWMPVHMNLQLYGWCSLPLVAFLLHVYGSDRKSTAAWCRPVLWVWSAALGIGAASWLDGHSSGKLFLDWTGYPRIFFPLAMFALWCLLVFSFAREWNGTPRNAKAVKIIGLGLLLAIPAILYIAAGPEFYPPINPDTGGPTGASQLESTLVVVGILLLLPFGLTERSGLISWPVKAAWIVFAAEVLLCLALGRANVSHHRPAQFISLGSVLVWLPLTPTYFRAFAWHANTRRWRTAFLVWWLVLLPTGWCLFLPGVLDRFKFTDGLVGHSLLAMAGFATSLLIFILIQLMGEDGWIFNRTGSFRLWHFSVLAYVLLMFVAGWQEGSHPAFSMVPGAMRNAVYWLRLILGMLMLIASTDWLLGASKLLREQRT